MPAVQWRKGVAGTFSLWAMIPRITFAHFSDQFIGSDREQDASTCNNPYVLELIESTRHQDPDKVSQFAADESLLHWPRGAGRTLENRKSKVSLRIRSLIVVASLQLSFIKSLTSFSRE